jgi:hypothetical protein
MLREETCLEMEEAQLLSSYVVLMYEGAWR